MDPFKLPDQTLQSKNLPGTNILVSTTQIDMNPIVYEVTATIGDHSYTERHTIGAMGGGSVLTVNDLQAAVDSYRQGVADSAAWQVAMSPIGGVAGQIK
ncbi:MAG: hypothetical protein JWO71_3123 [Candidatus Acidoferrum typicum]|nr:hypothetical protein [Candidatus Acidoferrum typicum]